MSIKTWEDLVEHAKACVLSRKIYVSFVDNAKNVGIVFNNIHNLSGLIAHGKYYPVQVDSLSDSHQVRIYLANFALVLQTRFGSSKFLNMPSTSFSSDPLRR